MTPTLLSPTRNDRTVVSEPIGQPAEMDDERTTDEVFSLLSNCRRRHIIHYLKWADRTVELRELTEHVSAWENGVDVSETTYNQRKRVYVSLRQTHLPKMAKLNFIEFDSERGLITLKDRIEEANVYLEPREKAELPWSGLYLGLAVVGGMLLGLVAAGLSPFALVSPLWYAFGVVGVFGLMATVHLRETMRVGDGEEPPSLGAGD